MLDVAILFGSIAYWLIGTAVYVELEDINERRTVESTKLNKLHLFALSALWPLLVFLKIGMRIARPPEDRE